MRLLVSTIVVLGTLTSAALGLEQGERSLLMTLLQLGGFENQQAQSSNPSADDVWNLFQNPGTQSSSADVKRGMELSQDTVPHGLDFRSRTNQNQPRRFGIANDSPSHPSALRSRIAKRLSSDILTSAGEGMARENKALPAVTGFRPNVVVDLTGPVKLSDEFPVAGKIDGGRVMRKRLHACPFLFRFGRPIGGCYGNKMPMYRWPSRRLVPDTSQWPIIQMIKGAIRKRRLLGLGSK